MHFLDICYNKLVLLDREAILACNSGETTTDLPSVLASVQSVEEVEAIVQQLIGS